MDTESQPVFLNSIPYSSFFLHFPPLFLPKRLRFQKFSLPLHPLNNNDGAIAQLVEQRTENPCVPGSIPGGTTENERVTKVTLFSFTLKNAIFSPMFKLRLNQFVNQNVNQDFDLIP